MSQIILIIFVLDYANNFRLSFKFYKRRCHSKKIVLTHVPNSNFEFSEKNKKGKRENKVGIEIDLMNI